MNIFGAQKNYLLDHFKPYQRSKLSDPAREGVRLQMLLPAVVGSSVWFGVCDFLMINSASPWITWIKAPTLGEEGGRKTTGF